MIQVERMVWIKVFDEAIGFDDVSGQNSGFGFLPDKGRFIFGLLE